MVWYTERSNRWVQEQLIASKLLKDFKAEIDVEQVAVIRGVFDVCSESDHIYESVRLRIEYPPKFLTRNTPPTVFLESHRERWKNVADSHIESDWRLCLFVPAESGIDFSTTDSLNDLFAVIHTFLFKQRIFQRRLIAASLSRTVARWPGCDRSHGIEGIMEAIKELGGVGRNEPCPCGNGLKFKKCHQKVIQSIKQQ